MLLLVVSDLHLGKGKFLKNGQLNILEDFFEDDRFAEFCEYYSTGKHYWANIHLVLNGDILNLIQIDIDGVFSHIIDDELTIRSIDSIANGHPSFFESLKKFIATPNKKLTYVIGNHDAGLAFPKAQEHIRSLVGEQIEFCDGINIDGVHIEHGHRFEVINTVPSDKHFVEGPNGKQILNLPWGSLFCVSVLPQLKKERPYIDKIRPMSAYVKFCLFHDIGFFFRMLIIVMRYFIQSNFDTYTKQNRNFKTTFSVLKQVTIYPKYEKKAKSILKRNPKLHTVVMGHTHVQEWRRFPGGKYYFNTGTWNPIPSIDAALHEDIIKMTYCMIEVHSKTKTLRSASLNVWQGKWRPYREDVSTT